MSKRRKNKKRRSVGASTRKRREEAAHGDGPSFLEMPEGMTAFVLKSTKTTRVDIIPYDVGKGNPKADKGELYWERTFWIHRNIGPNQDWVICPARTLKKPCPICEFISKLQKDPEADEATIKALRPSKRMIMNVIDKSDEEQKVQLWEISHAYLGKAMDEALESSYEDEDDNMDCFCDPEDGHYLKLVVEDGWQGKGYSVERVDFKPRKEDLDDETLEAAACLDDLLLIKTYKELKKLLLEDEDEDDEEDDEDEPKAKKSKKSKKSKKKKDEEEDDDEEDDGDDGFEDDDFDDEDDNEDNDDEEDDDEEDDDDEEEDEKPKKKKGEKKSSKKSSKKASKKTSKKSKKSKKNVQRGKERSERRRTG